MPDRVADYPIDSVFLERWSPRAFTGEAIPEAELFSLFEAARWAPSAYNSQPWRFLYARRDTPQWQPFLDILIEFNRSWVKNAAALVFVISKSTMLPPGKDREVPSHSHSFDSGAAWGALGVQAVKSGWATHGMVGLDFDKAFADLGLVEGWRVEAAIAIGRRGDRSILPEALQARETPSPRLPVKVIAMEGKFRPE
ncbi:nitroreductase family protein [Lichenicoccus sp.]|uniref:nitroreductase family protein n=1 Tax=Lichenicoccus sp. TaxID=2781899 RepID=UPI003D11405F